MEYRSTLAAMGWISASLLSAQTFYYIEAIAVVPPAPTTQDAVTIALTGGLASTGAYIVSASANVSAGVVTISIAAADPGGATVIVPHTEYVPVGPLAAGGYEIIIDGQFVGDFAPVPQHFLSVSGGGLPCDGLELISVRWHPFTDTALVVHVQNDGAVLFDYPGFILFSPQGDTLAKETVDFFGIGPESWHVMRIMDGVSMPEGEVMGHLELWTLFTTEFACAWEGPFTICPPAPCATIHPQLMNTGGGIALGIFNWLIYGPDEVVAQGQFELTSEAQYVWATACLPPGDYHIDVVPQQPPTGGALVYSVTGEGMMPGPSLPVSWNLPVLLPFSFYAPCADIGTGIHAPAAAPGFFVELGHGAMHIHTGDGGPLGEVVILDATGRLVFSRRTVADRLAIPLRDDLKGLLLIRVRGKAARVVVP